MSPAADPEPVGDLVDRTVERALRRRHGVQVGVIDREGRIVRAGGGLAEDSLVEIGSVTKVFTATLLAHAVVRGETRLDTPVRELLPGTVIPARDGVEITLEHLATHRSGLPRSPVGIGTVTGSLEMLRGRNPYAGFDEDALLSGVAETRLRLTPGTGRPAYSNAGFGLLGVALSRLAGTSYDELVADRVCRPLGLVDTVTPATATDEHRRRWAAGHRGRSRSAADWVLPGIPGAGALRSTVGDLLTFLAAQLDPDSTPLGEAIRLTHQQRHGTGRSGQALGWITMGQEPPLWWHNGGTGGFRSWAGFVPSLGRAAVVLSSSGRSVDLLALRLLRDLDARPGR